MNSDTNTYGVVPTEAARVGFVTGKAQARLIADGHGKAQEQQDLQDAMREDAYRLVGAVDAAECVFQYVLGYMVGINAQTEEEDWAAQEEAWVEQEAWQAYCGYGLDQDK